MKIVLATRKSPLALVQAEMVAAHLRAKLPDSTCELLHVVTTGDRQAEWSLAKQGGKGLFTAELEQALLRGDAFAAVHSCKDLPGEMTPGLVVAGYMPREDTHDVLVLREGVTAPATIGSSSPRRQQQVAKLFPQAKFTEIRGNVDTRLKKIASGVADATILAAAGLNRLHIPSWPGTVFRRLEYTESVPAVGQGAIAIQCRAADAALLAAALDAPTARRVTLERAIQTAIGGGCQMAFGALATDDQIHFYHEKTGRRALPLRPDDFLQPEATAARILKEVGLQ